MKRLFSLLLALCLLSGSFALAEGATSIAASTAAAAPELSTEFLWYLHDPRENPRAMEDVVADPDAVYGFRPSAEGSLAQYADADWTDPEVVEAGRQDRLAYHESIEDMYVMFNDMKAEGKSTEEIARAVSARRNEIRLEAYADDPEGLEAVKARNLEKYGHEEGPLADELYEKYGSWQRVLESAFSTNSGMDACLGLYDDYFDLYVASGQVEPDNDPSTEDRATYQLLLAANGWDSVMARHDSKKTLDAYYQDGRVLLEFSRRVDADSDYYWSAELENLQRRDFFIEIDKEGALYQGLSLPEDYAAELEASRLGEFSLDGDVLLSVQEHDGAWYVVTETEDAGVLDHRIETINEFWDQDGELTLQTGMKARHYIVYDQASGDQLVCWAALVFPDGHIAILQREVYDYDSPDEAEEGRLSAWFNAEDLRSITVVFDADTDAPRPLDFSVPAGTAFDILLGGEFPTVYTDEALTTEMDYDTSSKMGDTTLYVRADGT